MLAPTASSSTEEDPLPSTSRAALADNANKQKRKSTEVEKKSSRMTVKRGKNDDDDKIKQARLGFYQAHTESQKIYQEAQRQIIETQQEVKAYFQKLNRGKFKPIFFLIYDKLVKLFLDIVCNVSG